MMDAESWISADEAVEMGFATGVTNDDPSGDPMAMARTFKALAQYKHVPKALKPKNEDLDMCNCQCSACKDGECYACSDSMCDQPNCVDCPMEGTPMPGNALKNAKEKTKKVDSEDLTADCFIIAKDKSDPSTWKLPWKFSTEEKIKSHLRDALARFGQLKGVSAEEKATAWKKLVRLCKKYDIEVTQDDKSNAWHNEEIPADGCECECSACGGGDCAGCTNADCDDPNCVDCPQQQDMENHLSNLSLFRAKQWLLEHRA
jgi:hypothetical protein